MGDDTLLAFVFPAVGRGRVTAALDGGVTHHSNLTGANEQNAAAFSMGDSTAPIETVQRQGKKE